MVSDAHATLSTLQFSQIGVALHQITTKTSAATSSRAAEAEGTSCGGKSSLPKAQRPGQSRPSLSHGRHVALGLGAFRLHGFPPGRDGASCLWRKQQLSPNVGAG